MKTSIILTTTEAGTGKKRKRSFSDINPNATNNELKNFAQAFNELTTNTYVETNRVDTTNVDSGTSTSFRNITVENTTQGGTATISANIIENETINPAVFFYSNNTVQILTTTSIESQDPLIAKKTCSIPNSSGELYIGLRAKNNFYPDFVFANVP